MAPRPPLIQIPARAVSPPFSTARCGIRVTQPDHDLGTVGLGGLVRVSREPYVERCVVGSFPCLVHCEVSPGHVIGGHPDWPVSVSPDSPLPAPEDVRISCHLTAMTCAFYDLKTSLTI